MSQSDPALWDMNAHAEAQDGARHTTGLLPAHVLKGLIQAKEIQAERDFIEGQIQPSSIDLRLGAHAYRVRASFLPGDSTVKDKLAEVALHEIDLTKGAVLETGCVYLVPLLEHLALGYRISGTANAKSSTGRLDVFTRLVTDLGKEFDTVPAGYHGPLYAEISPRTFSILVRTGSRLNQLRLRRGTPVFSDTALKKLQEEVGVVHGPADIDNGIALTVDLSGEGDTGLVGYRAKRHTGVVDVDAPASCAIEDYWEPIAASPKRRLILDPDQFYILASKEAVHIPPTHAAEMMPFNPLVGEFRVHYAGFMDPGFGHAATGGHGSRVVLEVRSHKVPFILEDGQIIGRLVYERMVETPEILYGREMGSNYQAQRLKLSKHFR